MYLREVHAKKILDSRREPTIEVSVNGLKASSPSGKSTGKYETPSFHTSLKWNIEFLNKTTFDIEITSFNDLKKMEKFIKQKARLNDVKKFGANALFALESGTLKALAKEKKKELWEIINLNAEKFPVPVGNAIGGGLHSHNKNKPEFQEFLLIPQHTSFEENYRVMKKIHAQLKKIVNSQKENDEGAWETNLSSEEILEGISQFKNIRVGIDVAASSFL